VASFPIERLHIIGGGSKNRLLNQFTANAIGRKVIAGPSEATAIGNVMIQAMAMGVVSSLQEMRAIIHDSIETEESLPQESEAWEQAYQKFITLK
jgi:rhamnulokinase